jgi:hypothetical protein
MRTCWPATVSKSVLEERPLDARWRCEPHRRLRSTTLAVKRRNPSAVPWPRHRRMVQEPDSAPLVRSGSLRPMAAETALPAPDSRPTTPVQTSQPNENGTPLENDKSTPKQTNIALTPEVSSLTLSPLQSPSTPRASMNFMLPPVVVSPFQPSPGFNESHSSNPSESQLQTAAEIHTEDKPTPNAPAHSRKTADEEIQSQSGSGSDQVVSHSPPTRKLTRGKAIRIGKLSSSVAV